MFWIVPANERISKLSEYLKYLALILAIMAWNVIFHKLGPEPTQPNSQQNL